MIIETIQSFLQRLPLVGGMLQLNSTWSLVLLSLAALLLLWRFWAFTLRPALKPDEPPELPYWIPVLVSFRLGQAIEYVRDCHGVLTRARKHFGNTLEPYSIFLGGQKVYILTAPHDVSLAYKSPTLSYDSFNLDFTILYGVTPTSVHKVFAESSKRAPRHSDPERNPQNKSVAHWSEELYRQQLHPGERLDVLAQNFVICLRDSVDWNRLSRGHSTASDGVIQDLSLLKLCKDVIIDGATRVFFGERILQIEPDLAEAFCQFDNHSYMLMYKYPSLFANVMFGAKKRVNDAFTRYFELPKEERKGETWLATMEEREFRDLNFGNQDIAKFFSLMHWVVNANTYKLCFWLFAHLLHDPALYAAIKEETDRTITDKDDIDLARLTKACPRLEAFLNEILRFTVSSQSTRRVDSPTVIGNKTLQPGAFVFIPYRQLHFNEDVFGADAAEFKADRFLQNPELGKHPSFRPFGGGTTYCPGRFVARQEVCIFVALMLSKYDVALVGAMGEQSFPRVNDRNPALGAVGPVPGDDLRIKIRRR